MEWQIFISNANFKTKVERVIKRMKHITIGVTGASGSLYAQRVIEAFIEQDCFLTVVASEMGDKVFEYETGVKLREMVKQYSSNIHWEDNKNLFASIASGSYPCDGMAIVPCSMSTLGELAAGITPNLLTRAADVCLKQKRTLVIMPRETPFTSIHLQNMLTLSNCGAIILPAMPGFYQQPKTLSDMIDFMAGKVLECFQIEHKLYERWSGRV